MASITSANAVLIITIPNLYSNPQQLQGFAADDIFDIDATETAETMMGVDGVLSAGYVFTPKKQKISLQADSASNVLFETWKEAQDQITDVYFASGSITLSAINRKYTLLNGVLSMYPTVAAAKRVLQPKVYEITWQNVVRAPTGANAL